MNYVRTAILLVALTALLTGLGYLLGGPDGVLIAFLVAAATNFLAYWKGDRLVLSTHGRRSTSATVPELVHIVAELADRRPADAAHLSHGQSAAECVRGVRGLTQKYRTGIGAHLGLRKGESFQGGNRLCQEA